MRYWFDTSPTFSCTSSQLIFFTTAVGKHMYRWTETRENTLWTLNGKEKSWRQQVRVTISMSVYIAKIWNRKALRNNDLTLLLKAVWLWSLSGTATGNSDPTPFGVDVPWLCRLLGLSLVNGHFVLVTWYMIIIAASNMNQVSIGNLHFRTIRSKISGFKNCL